MSTTEDTADAKNSTADKRFWEGERADAHSNLGKVTKQIDSLVKTGTFILYVAAFLSAVLAGIGFGAIVDEPLHQVAVAFVIVLLGGVLGKKAALSVPQVSLFVVLGFSFAMIFLSAAFFVLGFVRDEPVRYTVSDQIDRISSLTIKYNTESQKMDRTIARMGSYERSLREQAENERQYGSLSGAAGDNGVVYRTYLETAEFIALQRRELEKGNKQNNGIIEKIETALADFREITWDKTIKPNELQVEGSTREHRMQELFVSIRQNSDLAIMSGNAIDEYAKKINAKRADKSNVLLRNSQSEVLEDLKKSLGSFAEEMRGMSFVSRTENVETIKIDVPDVYLASLRQIPRYFYLWLTGIMLDIAAPLIFYLMIRSFIARRDRLQEDIRTYEKKLEQLAAPQPA